MEQLIKIIEKTENKLKEIENKMIDMTEQESSIFMVEYIHLFQFNLASKKLLKKLQYDQRNNNKQ